jgi:hypothetical protein
MHMPWNLESMFAYQVVSPLYYLLFIKGIQGWISLSIFFYFMGGSPDSPLTIYFQEPFIFSFIHSAFNVLSCFTQESILTENLLDAGMKLGAGHTCLVVPTLPWFIYIWSRMPWKSSVLEVLVNAVIYRCFHGSIWEVHSNLVSSYTCMRQEQASSYRMATVPLL